jgi:hypothetical protein
VSFEESLPLKPSKIAVKGSPVWDWSKQDSNIVGSEEPAALREDRQDDGLRHKKRRVLEIVRGFNWLHMLVYDNFRITLCLDFLDSHFTGLPSSIFFTFNPGFVLTVYSSSLLQF